MADDSRTEQGAKEVCEENLAQADDVCLTDLIDQIERDSFNRSLANRPLNAIAVKDKN